MILPNEPDNKSLDRPLNLDKQKKSLEQFHQKSSPPQTNKNTLAMCLHHYETDIYIYINGQLKTVTSEKNYHLTNRYAMQPMHFTLLFL